LAAGLVTIFFGDDFFFADFFGVRLGALGFITRDFVFFLAFFFAAIAESLPLHGGFEEHARGLRPSAIGSRPSGSGFADVSFQPHTAVELLWYTGAHEPDQSKTISCAVRECDRCGLAAPQLAQAAGNSTPSVQFPAAPRDRVAVAAYPFREFIVGWKGWDGKTPSTMPASQQIELKDFAAHVAEKFSVHKIEPWSPVFPSTDPKYLEQLRAAVEKARSAVVDIAVDAGHSQYAMDAAERERAVTGSKQWIDVGAALGSPSIRTHIDG